MARSITKTEVLDPETRRRLAELYHGDAMLFWRRCLADKLSRYQFEAALAGRPVAEETAAAVLAAVDADVRRVWELLRLEFDGREVLALAKERYLD